MRRFVIALLFIAASAVGQDGADPWADDFFGKWIVTPEGWNQVAEFAFTRDPG